MRGQKKKKKKIKWEILIHSATIPAECWNSNYFIVD